MNKLSTRWVIQQKFSKLSCLERVMKNDGSLSGRSFPSRLWRTMGVREFSRCLLMKDLKVKDENSDKSNDKLKDNNTGKDVRDSEHKLIKEKTTPTFLTQVYNLKNGIEAMEQQVLAYFPKSSIQMTPLFLNEMMKNPKNYYWIVVLAILGTSAFLYTYYLLYYKQFVGKLLEQERNDMESAVTTLKSIQLNANNYGSLPSLMSLNIEKLVEKLNSDEINIEIRRETLSTIYSLCQYDYFVNQLVWKRDFLSSLVDSLQVGLTIEVTKAILEKLFSSKIGMKILREECPTNFHNAIQKLVADNRHDISVRLLYHYFDGSVDEIKQYYENRLHLDSTEAVNKAQSLKQNNTSTTELNLGENTKNNTLKRTLMTRIAFVPLEVASVVVYCLYSWKKRANSPIQFNNHIRKWAIVAGLVPAVADILATILRSKHYGKKIENFYLQGETSHNSTQFSPKIVNLINSSIRSVEVISLLLLWRRARFILVPTFVNMLLTYNIHQFIDKNADLKYFDKNMYSTKANHQHRKQILSEKTTDDEYEE